MKDKNKPVRVATKDGDVLRISGTLPEQPSWARSTPMPPVPSEKYQRSDDKD